MTIEQLNQTFGIDGHLTFARQNGLTCAQIQLPACTATVYLHGAHLTAWQPAGEQPVIFLSDKSAFAEGKAIRGGVPICFPWFGPRSFGVPPGGDPGPSHGFARLQEWQIAFAGLAGDRLNLTFMLEPSDLSRSLGFDHFRVVYEIFLGTTLTMRLTVANAGSAPLHFEEALHSYFAVGDVREASVTGLEQAHYMDKADGMKSKTTPDGALRLTGETDRVFPGDDDRTVIHDEMRHRRIVVDKAGSLTTVLWNPWSELAAKLADLPDDAWPEFLCVEVANTGSEAITLQPGESHSMQADISVQKG